jgi:hypothetical protein
MASPSRSTGQGRELAKFILFANTHSKKICQYVFSSSLRGHVGAYDTRTEKYLLMDGSSTVPFGKAQYNDFKGRRTFFYDMERSVGMPPQTKKIVDYNDARPEAVIRFERVPKGREKRIIDKLREKFFVVFTAQIRMQMELAGWRPTDEMVEVMRMMILREQATMLDVCVLHAFQLATEKPEHVEIHIGSLAFMCEDGEWDIEYGDGGVDVLTQDRMGNSAR